MKKFFSFFISFILILSFGTLAQQKQSIEQYVDARVKTPLPSDSTMLQMRVERKFYAKAYVFTMPSVNDGKVTSLSSIKAWTVFDDGTIETVILTGIERQRTGTFVQSAVDWSIFDVNFEKKPVEVNIVRYNRYGPSGIVTETRILL